MKGLTELILNRMVEYSVQLDRVFQSFADSTRRDILQRVTRTELSISELAEKYSMSFAATSKHIKILESALLITKTRKGREQLISANPKAIKAAYDYVDQYKSLWEQRFAAIDKLLMTGQK